MALEREDVPELIQVFERVLKLQPYVEVDEHLIGKPVPANVVLDLAVVKNRSKRTGQYSGEIRIHRLLGQREDGGIDVICLYLKHKEKIYVFEDFNRIVFAVFAPKKKQGIFSFLRS